MNDKQALRRRCRQVRQAFSPAQVAQASQAVCDHLSAWLPFQQAITVLGYLAFRNEIDLSPLFARWPDKRWLVPRIQEGERPHLVLHPYDPARLVRHRFGMLEPDPALPQVPPHQVDLALVPGVAFDRQGGRLGFGGGFYDRLLPRLPHAVWVGVTYDELVLDAIPMQPWDRHVPWLVTPTGLVKTAFSG